MMNAPGSFLVLPRDPQAPNRCRTNGPLLLSFCMIFSASSFCHKKRAYGNET